MSYWVFMDIFLLHFLSLRKCMCHRNRNYCCNQWKATDFDRRKRINSFALMWYSFLVQYPTNWKLRFKIVLWINYVREFLIHPIIWNIKIAHSLRPLLLLILPVEIWHWLHDIAHQNSWHYLTFIVYWDHFFSLLSPPLSSSSLAVCSLSLTTMPDRWKKHPFTIYSFALFDMQFFLLCFLHIRSIHAQMSWGASK